MFQPYPLFIAVRYLRTRRRNRFATFVALVSIMGIALSVGALIIVLSVMNGFEREVARHVLGMTAHAIMVPPSGALSDWSTVVERSDAYSGVSATSPYVRGSGMLSRKGEVRGVVVEGILPQLESAVTDIESYIEPTALAQLDAATNTVLMGRNLATELGLAAGDDVTLVVPDWDADGGALSPRYLRLHVGALFHIGMHQFDSKLVLMNFHAAQNLFRMHGSASGIRVRFDNADDAALGVRRLVLALGIDLQVIDWTQYHRNFFLALESQKRIMFIILVLIVAVAAFNIAANMIMVVTEKIRDIAILRTLGSSRTRIIALFLVQGLMIGITGAALGALFGAWGAHESETVARVVEKLLNIDLINAEVYFIDYLPADLHLSDVLAVTLASIALSLLATLYPAYRAASTNPAEAVHRD